MCESRVDFLNALTRLVVGLDPRAMGAEHAQELVSWFSRLEHLAAAGKTLCAGRVAASGTFPDAGRQSAAAWLANETGDSIGGAMRLLEAADQLQELPVLEGAFRSGELSPAQIVVAAAAASDDPSKEQELLDHAKKGTVRNLRREAERIRAAARSEKDAQERYDRVRSKRSLRWWTDSDGAFRLDGRLTPDAGAFLVAEIEPEAKRVFKAARDEGRREPFVAYVADALVNLVTGTSGPSASSGRQSSGAAPALGAAATAGPGAGAGGGPGAAATAGSGAAATAGSGEAATAGSGAAATAGGSSGPGGAATAGPGAGAAGGPGAAATAGGSSGPGGAATAGSGEAAAGGPGAAATAGPGEAATAGASSGSGAAATAGGSCGSGDGATIDASSRSGERFSAAPSPSSSSSGRHASSGPQPVPAREALSGRGTPHGQDSLSGPSGSAVDPSSRRAGSFGPRARRASHSVILRVDLAALRRGELEGGEVCEIPGVGPVPLAVARRLIGDAFLKLVITDGVDVQSVTHLGRHVSAFIETALQERDPVCVVPGCDAANFLERDHWRQEFAKGGPTDLPNLCRLCSRHHHLKHNKGFTLRGGPGKWEWLAPKGCGAREDERGR
jgi:hypothetical protein